VTTLGLNLFSGTYFNKLLLLWYPVTENSLIQEVHQVSQFFAGKQNRAYFQNVMLL